MRGKMQDYNKVFYTLILTTKIYSRIVNARCYKKHRKERIESKQKYNQINSCKIRNYGRHYYEKNKEKVKQRQKSYDLQKNYGITLEQREIMLRAQDYKCAICGKHFKSSKDTHTDHSHVTGRVRGLLCGNCNHALGLMHDDTKTLESAVRYLKKNQ